MEIRYEQKNDLVAENVGKGDFVNLWKILKKKILILHKNNHYITTYKKNWLFLKVSSSF